MRPFGWLPNWPTWSLKPRNNAAEDGNNAYLTTSSSTTASASATSQPHRTVVQPVNTEWIAVLNQPIGHDLDISKYVELQNDPSPKSHDLDSWEHGLDVSSIWPGPELVQSTHTKIDMDPSLPPNHLVDLYKETLLGSGPMALFPKQVLPKARIGMDPNHYASCLHELFLSPANLDAKYSLDNSENSSFFAEIRGLVDDMRPLSLLVKSLRVRDTQLQLILGLELFSLGPSNSDEVSAILDLHFDRLCIWQAVDSTDLVNEFCSTVLIPYFKARAPRKTKQFVRVSRGTLKYRNKQSRTSSTKAAKAVKRMPSAITTAATTATVATPRRSLASSGAPGLLKALQMQNLAVSHDDTSQSMGGLSSDNNNGSETHSRGRSSKAATRSISHPVYRQQASRSQVEVRFKKTKQKEPGSRASPAPLPSRTDTTIIPGSATHPRPSAINPISRAQTQPFQPKPTDTQPQADFIEATPTKVRTSYLGSLPPPTTLFDDDDDNAIGSTDSDE